MSNASQCRVQINFGEIGKGADVAGWLACRIFAHMTPLLLRLLLGITMVLCGLTGAVEQVMAQAYLRAGPMLGYNTMREVAVWVQTTEAAEVRLRYWPINDVRDIYYSASAKTNPQGAFCATLIADSLQAGTIYEYQILLGSRALPNLEPLRFQTQKLWEFRSDPPTFTFALGSCFYANEPAYDRPYERYGGSDSIFLEIDSLRPDFMLWLGDNTYLRPGDFDSRSGVLHRYSHTRAVAELQPLLRHAHHYAIWDDHDYGPNDSDRSYVHKHWTREAFDLFWANPATRHPQLLPGIGTQFRYGDAEFFLLDDRTFRAPNHCQTCDPQPLLGQAQVDWLIEALVSSGATWKFVAVGNQFVSDAPIWENFSANHAAERAEILRRLQAERLQNVIFLTGDRHHSELSHLVQAQLEVYDFTVSPLTAGAVGDKARREGNTLLVEGSYYGERNFGTVTLAGPRQSRTATLRLYSAKGELVWERVLPAAQEVD